MKDIFKINVDLNIPIYKQLVDAINTAIKRGELNPGQQLPTVCEMTEQLKIARGTVKRAYDELEKSGIIDKVQGRGTFVKYQPSNSVSRKERAMYVIEDMLNQLEDMGMSLSEINIFLNLKLREKSKQESLVKIAMVECNPENLSQISEQLRHIQGVDLYSYMMENIEQYPYKLNDDVDLVVTTPSHAEYIENILAEKKKLLCVALRPSAHCLSRMIKIRPRLNVGIITFSERFGKLLYDTCKIYAEDVTLKKPLVFSLDSDIRNYLNNTDTLLLPKLYEKYFSEKEANLIRSFKGEIIECHYEMDEGSMLYLESKIKRMLEKKSI